MVLEAAINGGAGTPVIYNTKHFEAGWRRPPSCEVCDFAKRRAWG